MVLLILIFFDPWIFRLRSYFWMISKFKDTNLTKSWMTVATNTYMSELIIKQNSSYWMSRIVVIKE